MSGHKFIGSPKVQRVLLALYLSLQFPVCAREELPIDALAAEGDCKIVAHCALVCVSWTARGRYQFWHKLIVSGHERLLRICGVHIQSFSPPPERREWRLSGALIGVARSPDSTRMFVQDVVTHVHVFDTSTLACLLPFPLPSEDDLDEIAGLRDDGTAIRLA
ncbi:uncharacterized protein BXZ73DRAFT_99831 [Epithele typhae]|uniref:uncharacterized protein n=1 Tax=Epithele typhae TaxID=378194 RepID=UPI00200850ED|nr:uncharacterized protein BXZ73DRAFT_99831 [Epithele typhae]KAH9938769.1 hypothetical protein BXZ73DRAFT_99831 [Epithele typhae]